LAVAVPFSGSTLPDTRLDAFGELGDWALNGETDNAAMTMRCRQFRIMPTFIAGDAAKLPDEFDAGQIAPAPDDLAIMPRPRVTREGQPQGRRQRIGAIHDDLGAGDGNIVHHALAHREAAIERDPCRFPQSFSGFPFLLRCCHFYQS
jgi:hypothetical protein